MLKLVFTLFARFLLPQISFPVQTLVPAQGTTTLREVSAFLAGGVKDRTAAFDSSVGLHPDFK